MESVGSLLRSERKRQGRQITEIAAALCITQAYLNAIEADNLESLPGTFFYKSFVRQYATLLGISESRIRPAVEAITAPAAEPLLPGQDARFSPAEAGFPTDWRGELQRFLSNFNPAKSAIERPSMGMLDPIVEASNRYFSGHRMGASLAGLLTVLLLCSGFYAWWNHTPKPEPAEAASARPAPPVQAVSTGTAPAKPQINVTTSQTDDGHAVLNLSATDEVWLSVTANGKEVFSGVLKPSQTKTLTGIEAAQMKVGNAGGLDVSWNGKPIGPIGPRGQVRTVVLTPENFEILPPKPAEDDGDDAL